MKTSSALLSNIIFGLLKYLVDLISSVHGYMTDIDFNCLSVIMSQMLDRLLLLSAGDTGPK